MNLLIPEEELHLKKSRDFVPLKCERCSKKFEMMVKEVKRSLNGKKPNTGRFCSRECFQQSSRKRSTVECAHCRTRFERKTCDIRDFNFCSRSCSATYNNLHKKHGGNRSKGEQYLEEMLRKALPNCDIETNVRDLIPSRLECDIVIRDKSIVIEVNGPTHYFPIYGKDKFEKIVNRDIVKQKELCEAGFMLVVIDVSQHKCWKTTKPYLDKQFHEKILPFI